MVQVMKPKRAPAARALLTNSLAMSETDDCEDEVARQAAGMKTTRGEEALKAWAR
jgi:hypothetical protein